MNQAVFLFSLCARTLGTVPQSPALGPEYVSPLTALCFSSCPSLFSSSLFIHLTASYWNCILSGTPLALSQFWHLTCVHRGLTLVGCQLALPYRNWLVDRRPQPEHKFSQCPDLTPDLLKRPISGSVTLPLLPLSILLSVFCKGFCVRDGCVY